MLALTEFMQTFLGENLTQIINEHRRQKKIIRTLFLIMIPDDVINLAEMINGVRANVLSLTRRRCSLQMMAEVICNKRGRSSESITKTKMMMYRVG